MCHDRNSTNAAHTDILLLRLNAMSSRTSRNVDIKPRLRSVAVFGNQINSVAFFTVIEGAKRAVEIGVDNDVV